MDFINCCTQAPTLFNCGCSPASSTALEFPVLTKSLSSVVDYINAGMDKSAQGTGEAVIHVAGPQDVLLYKRTGNGNERRCLLKAHADLGTFYFGKYMTQEEFVLNLRNGFAQDREIDKLLQSTAKIRTITSVEHMDNGVSNFTVTRQEIENGPEWQNPIMLRPYRTFSEVDQPESPFVFRMEHDRNVLSMALFEAGGRSWEHEAVMNIKEYLKEKLALADVIILA